MRKTLIAIFTAILASCQPAYACTIHEENNGGCDKYWSAPDTAPVDNAGSWIAPAPHRMGVTARTSSINPGIPANGSQVASGPLRSNFQAAYNDITSLFSTTNTLGSMATQSAGGVAITGGNIDGTVLGQSVPIVGTFNTLTMNNLSPGLLYISDGSQQITSDIGLFYTGALLEMIHTNNSGQESLWNVFADPTDGAGMTLRDDYDKGTTINLLGQQGGNNLLNFETSNNSHDGSFGGIQFFADSGQFGANPLGTGDVVGSIFYGSQNASQVIAKEVVTAAATQSSTSSPGLKCTYITKNGVKVLPSTAVMCLDYAQHLTLPSTEAPPAVSSCGTGSPSVSGNDQDGDITTGTGAPTACTLTYGKAFTAAPHCTANASAGTISIGTPPSTSAVTFTISAGLTSGHIYYHCF